MDKVCHQQCLRREPTLQIRIFSPFVQRLTENAKDLKLRPEEFESILVSLGFGHAQAFGVTGDGGALIPGTVDTRKLMRVI